MGRSHGRAAKICIIGVRIKVRRFDVHSWGGERNALIAKTREERERIGFRHRRN